MTSLRLPTPTGLVDYTIRNSPVTGSTTGPMNRVAYAAAHIVADPLADIDPWEGRAIDWDLTLAFREHLWGLGLGVAEAMDTAQRGMGLDWAGAQELIRRTQAAVAARGGALVAFGAGTDQLPPGPDVSIEAVIATYEEQIGFVEGLGGRVILMASRALAKAARSPDDYARVYDRLLRQVRQPVIIHWLGEMFDPALAGYWGSADHAAAMETAIDVINSHADRVDGVKISLLDKGKEIAMRRRLAPGVKTYTGDDFSYAELIAGDDQGFSHALLGIFVALAPVAAAARQRLAAVDRAECDRLLEPTVPLSRHIFRAPTRYYKTGVVFLAWLNGFQDHFVMLGGQQSARSVQHFAELFRLADAARVLRDPDLAADRMRQLLAVAGV